MMTTQSLGRTVYNADMTSPQILPAGVVTSYLESAKECLSWVAPEGRPVTPPEQRKYRQSTVHEPGKVFRHHGCADDPVPTGIFGAPSYSAPGESVAAFMKSYPDSEVARWKLDRSEDIYASSRREPLGTGYQRGHVIPSGMGTATPFGMTYDAVAKDKAGQARAVVFPVDGIVEEEEAVRAMYLRSHAAYAPGEQRRRDYQWDKAGVDPVTNRFGAASSTEGREGVKKALQPDLDQGVPHHARVASKLHEDYKVGCTDYLGKARLLGTGERGLPKDHTFGMHSLRHGAQAGVGELFRTGYTQDQLRPDADLGKSLREGYRNQGPEQRVFGVPSVRTDVALPKTRSVANTINYGNEPDAMQLLAPSRSAERGVGDEHYLKLTTRQEMQELVTEAGIDLTGEDFDIVFGLAADADGQGEDRCCLDTFFRARHAVLSQSLVVPMPF